MRVCRGRSDHCHRPRTDPVSFCAFGFKPPDLGPQLFDLLIAAVDTLMVSAMTAHHDLQHQAHHTKTVEYRRHHSIDCTTALSLGAGRQLSATIYGLRTDLVYIVHA
jgi:hypothetical protein